MDKHQGHLWVNEDMEYRLLSFDGTRWTSYLSRLLDSPKRLQMIFSDSQGRVWLDCGVLSVKDGWTWGLSYYQGGFDVEVLQKFESL